MNHTVGSVKLNQPMLVMSVCSEYISSYEVKHCYELSNVRMVSFKVTTIENDDNRKEAF